MSRVLTQQVPISQQLHLTNKQTLAIPEFVLVLGFLFLHVPLAILMEQSPYVGTAHGLVVFGFGIISAASSKYSLERVAYVAAYIAGAEVLWRMTEVRVLPWEFGKYATIAIMVLAMLRTRQLKGPALPFWYFLLLLPASILTLTESSLSEARERLSFNLSGPFALMISMWFFSHLKITTKQRQILYLAVIGPVLAISTVVLYRIDIASTLNFTVGSNAALSGGYSPNQVTSALALGALMAFWSIYSVRNKLLRVLFYALLILFLTQSVLTFSRSGIINAGGSFVVAVFFLLRDPKTRIKLILGGCILFLVGNYVIWPQLNEFTGGKLEVRYAGEQRLSGRDDIVKADLGLWKMFPLNGVGPGMGKHYRDVFFNHRKPAHTEQTRMLAEHGTLGFVSLMILLVIIAQKILQAPSAEDKAFTASMLSFGFIYMMHAAMRLVTPAFTYGLPYLTVLPDDQDSPDG